MNADDPGGFTESGMRSLIRNSAERVGIDPNKVKIDDVADATLLREVQQALGIQCRGGYLCPSSAIK
jgi:hypothetical protein